MIKQKKLSTNHVGLLLILSLNVFFIIAVVMGLIGGGEYLLYRLGLLSMDIIAHPVAGIVPFYLASLATGVAVVVMIRSLFLAPMQDMVQGMRELAQGNFAARIGFDGAFCPREIAEFTASFNKTAQELGSIELLRQEFVNNFSHEFKTPIVSIGGFAKLLQEEELPRQEQQEYLGIIVQESERLAALATNILNLSKVENQTILSGQSSFALDEQIRRAVLMLAAKWQAKELELDLELAEVVYYGNADLLNQVWLNLLDNAIKFSPRGGRIAVILHEQAGALQCSITDQGCGMTPEVRQRAFDKFYQADGSRTTEGNGLGLALVQRVVALHEGEITVTSQPGQGATMTVRLPQPTQTAS